MLTRADERALERQKRDGRVATLPAVCAVAPPAEADEYEEPPLRVPAIALRDTVSPAG
jgi:hypothetical protein